MNLSELVRSIEQLGGQSRVALVVLAYRDWERMSPYGLQFSAIKGVVVQLHREARSSYAITYDGDGMPLIHDL